MKYEKGTFATVPVGVIKGIDPLAQVVFMWMCMHMNSDGVCFPSIGLLCKESGIKARSTVQIKIALLEQIGLIVKSTRFSGNEQTSNEYQIVLENNVSIDDRGMTVGQGVDRQSDGVGQLSDTPRPTISHRTKPNELNPGTKPNLAAPSAANLEGDEVNKIFEVFYKINPTINYANKSQRQATEFLITKLGFEKTLASATAATAVQGKKYAPVITTPYQLKEKLTQLVIYYEQEKPVLPFAQTHNYAQPSN